MRRGRLVLCAVQAVLLALGVLTASAIACEGAGEEHAESTTLSTKLSGEGKEGEELTVLEGSKAKDKATLSGKNASKATGKVTYKVYSEKECKTLVVSAGEVTVSGESVPVSNEEELEAGKAYYWQAHYGGDTKNKESTSPCTEILDVKAKTTLSTTLSGESKEGSELTAPEGLKIRDDATLGGSHSSSATGKVIYKVYSDSECKDLVAEAGEETVSSGSVPASGEEELEGGKTYFWQATYKGDSLHQESTSACGSEKLIVKLPPPAPATNCPITSEGVTFDAEVTASNETALREDVVTKTWLPTGKVNAGCTEVAELVAMEAGEEYRTYVDELVVPGAYIFVFKWHESGGPTFETLGVANSAVALQFEPIGATALNTIEAEIGPEEVEEVEEEGKGSGYLREPFVEPFKTPIFGEVGRVVIIVHILTPDKVHITKYRTTKEVFASAWPPFVHIPKAEVLKEVLTTKGDDGVQCVEVTFNYRVETGVPTPFGGFILGETVEKERIAVYCADGTAKMFG
jgi:hypothetical protein